MLAFTLVTPAHTSQRPSRRVPYLDIAALWQAQEAQRWWERLLRDETLGRLVWIMENTLNTNLLAQSCAVPPGADRAPACCISGVDVRVLLPRLCLRRRNLSLLSCRLCLLTQVVEGAATVAAGRSQQPVVQQLLSLDLLPLLASVLTGWLARTHGERQVAAWEEQPRRSSSSSSGSAAAQEQCTSAAHSAPDATAEASEAPAPATAAPLGPAAKAHAQPPAAVVAAEVSDSAVQEAQALLEALMADPAGEQALNVAGALCCIRAAPAAAHCALPVGIPMHRSACASC